MSCEVETVEQIQRFIVSQTEAGIRQYIETAGSEREKILAAELVRTAERVSQLEAERQHVEMLQDCVAAHAEENVRLRNMLEVVLDEAVCTPDKIRDPSARLARITAYCRETLGYARQADKDSPLDARSHQVVGGVGTDGIGPGAVNLRGGSTPQEARQSQPGSSPGSVPQVTQQVTFPKQTDLADQGLPMDAINRASKAAMLTTEKQSEHATPRERGLNVNWDRWNLDSLREALFQLRDDIIRNAPDTVWVGPGQTACERITEILGDDWGVDGKCEPRGGWTEPESSDG